MVVQDTSPGRGGGAGPIKGVMGWRAQATDPPPSPGAAAPTTGGRSPSPARTRTGGGPHARTSPLFPITYLATPRLTLAGQDCGGYTGCFWWGCCRSGNSCAADLLR